MLSVFEIPADYSCRKASVGLLSLRACGTCQVRTKVRPPLWTSAIIGCYGCCYFTYAVEGKAQTPSSQGSHQKSKVNYKVLDVGRAFNKNLLLDTRLKPILKYRPMEVGKLINVKQGVSSKNAKNFRMGRFELLASHQWSCDHSKLRHRFALQQSRSPPFRNQHTWHIARVCLLAERKCEGLGFKDSTKMEPTLLLHEVWWFL